MNRVVGRDLVVYSIKHILLIPLGMEDLELRRIEKSACIQSVEFEEVAPVLAAVAKIDGSSRGSKRTVRRADVADGFCLAHAGPGRHINHQARFVAVLCRRSAVDYFECLDGIRG